MSGFSQVQLPTEVAQAVLSGQPEAVAEAYRLLVPAVMTLAGRILSDRGLAEEVVQETFIELLEKSTQIRSPDAISAWVRRVAVNHCLMLLRTPWHSRRAGIDAELVMSESTDERFTSDDGMDFTLAHNNIELAFATLSEDARAVLWLHDVEGYTHKEIAQLMGKTPSFSKSQLARAYEKLILWRKRGLTEADLQAFNGPEGKSSKQAPTNATEVHVANVPHRIADSLASPIEPGSLAKPNQSATTENGHE